MRDAGVGIRRNVHTGQIPAERGVHEPILSRVAQPVGKVSAGPDQVVPHSRRVGLSLSTVAVTDAAARRASGIAAPICWLEYPGDPWREIASR